MFTLTIPLKSPRDIFESQKLASPMFENINVIYFPQVLEYQPGPPDQWVEVGTLQERRGFYGLVSIGKEQLPCL